MAIHHFQIVFDKNVLNFYKKLKMWSTSAFLMNDNTWFFFLFSFNAKFKLYLCIFKFINIYLTTNFWDLVKNSKTCALVVQN